MRDKIKNIMQQFLQFYLTILIILIVVDVVLLIVLTLDQSRIFEFFQISSSTVVNIYNFDLLVSLLLFINLLMVLITREDRRDFIKNNWVFIPAVIPFDFIFLGQLGVTLTLPLAILRLIHILALIRTITKMGSTFVKFTKKTGLSYGITIITILFLCTSFSFLLVERGVNPEVKNYEDSAWYTVTTMTTTGYGDIVPVTPWGRFIGAFMMISGLAFTGYATASVASMLVDKFREEQDKDRKALAQISQKLNQERKKESEEIKESLNDILKRLDEKK